MDMNLCRFLFFLFILIVIVYEGAGWSSKVVTFWLNVKRAVIIVVDKKKKSISFSLATFLIECQLITKLTIQQGWEEGGAERESDPRQRKRVFGKVQVSLVRAEWDQRGEPRRHNMRWVAR